MTAATDPEANVWARHPAATRTRKRLAFHAGRDPTEGRTVADLLDLVALHRGDARVRADVVAWLLGRDPEAARP